jgi:uncharacterized protein
LPGRAARTWYSPRVTIRERLARLDWGALEASLWERGYALTPPVLTAKECSELARLYGDDRRFRKRVDMARLRFGVGDYKYFGDPLPAPVRELRVHGYRHLAPIANRWLEAYGERSKFPRSLTGLRALCARHGQTKPTPLLLRYRAGGYNRLHQDLYGEIAFPLQMTCFLSRTGKDFLGGAFLLVESEFRAQSRGEALDPARGALVIFPTRERPVRGARGVRRARIRHGLATVARGSRYALGVIFHDAR